MTSQDLDNVRVIHGATRIVRVASVSVCYSVRLNLFFFVLGRAKFGVRAKNGKSGRKRGAYDLV